MEELFASGDLGYFPLSSHLRMLQDRRRMAAFRRALRRLIVPGSTVVDVGSGTGALAFMAAELGAGRVIAIEQTALATHARRLSQEHPLGSQVRFLKLDALTDKLPDIEADLVICELLGHFGVGENIERVLRRVSRKMLKRGGAVLPGALELFIAPVECSALNRQVGFWDRSVAGVSLAPLQALASSHVYLRQRESVRVLGPHQLLAATEFGRDSTHGGLSNVSAEVFIGRRGRLDAIMGFFRARLAPGLWISTAPDRPRTHWGQVLFPVGVGVSVQRKDRVSFTLGRRPRGQSCRWSWNAHVLTRGGAQLFEARADEWE